MDNPAAQFDNEDQYNTPSYGAVQQPTAANGAIKPSKSDSKLITDDGAAAEKQPYPKSVFFIVSNEFCERFSFYGMKAILTLFFTRMLLMEDNTATSIYHGFSMLCYLTPIFGGMVADAWLGKYKTILYISLVYVSGLVLLAVTAIPTIYTDDIDQGIRYIGPMIGLLLIAIGTGGIKPCVSAFGGDQFSKGQEKQLQQFFSVFYISINAGSLISTFVTPILRSDIPCFGGDCYPLAFGVPAILLIIALLLFIMGKSLYKIYPPEENVLLNVIKCFWRAFKNRNVPHPKGTPFLYRAKDKFPIKFIDDIRAISRVLVMMLPLPVFWSLFDQTGSRWILMAEKMDGQVGSWNIKPDQMQVINPLFIVLFIPLFEMVVYPLLDKCNIPNRPLQRMSMGMIFAAGAFVVAAFVHIALDKTLLQLPEVGKSRLSFTNGVRGCDLNYNLTAPTQLPDTSVGVQYTESSVSVDVDSGPHEGMIWCGQSQIPWTANLTSQGLYRVLLTGSLQDQGQLSYITYEEHTEKPKAGRIDMTVLSSIDVTDIPGQKVSVVFGFDPDRSVLVNSTGFISDQPLTIVDPGTYSVSFTYYDDNDTAVSWMTEEIRKVTVYNGGGYSILVYNNGTQEHPQLLATELSEVVPPSTFSMLYQIPQYIVLTAGEIMFSITGLEFAYSQAPLSMKSVMQSAWLLTVAFGNLIVIIVAEARIFDIQWQEFLLFAGLMIFVTIIFILLSIFYYEYVSYDREEEKDEEEEEKDDKYLESVGVVEQDTVISQL